MKHYCHNCGCEQKTKILSQKEVFTVKGDPIEVVSDILVCDECTEELFNEELDTKNLDRAYEAFRRKHKLLSPSEIKELRSRIGSGRMVATLLGWSQATLVRYENGAIPDAAHHDQLLRLKNDPALLETLYRQRGDRLSSREREKLEAKINNPNDILEGPMEYLNRVFKTFYVNGITNVEFDFEKLAALVQYFALVNQELVKTKLQKLLFYTDFLSVKRYGIQITGLPYIHHHYGPVPAHHDLIQWALDSLGVIEVKPYEGPLGGEIFEAKETPVMERLFTWEEIDVIHSVAGYFKSFTASRISDFSHSEEGYINTRQREIIPFSYSSSLKLD